MTTFKDMGLESEILRGIKALGFSKPTPVQAEVIPLLLKEKSDITGLAHTGTGKTAAFGLPLVQLVSSTHHNIQAIVLCPTRELCRQVTTDLQAFSLFLPLVNIRAVYGGADIRRQMQELRRGAQIVVATPGRLNDLINRKKIHLANVSHVVLDEADEMLQMGFQDKLNAILSQIPADRRMLLFSATMSRQVRSIAGRYMKAPIEITVGKRNTSTKNICHEVYTVDSRDRYNALRRIVDHNRDIYSIIFCRTRKETSHIAKRLLQDGYSAGALHGELSQSQRDTVLNGFRNRHLQLLVATDVAARGLDVNDLTHVINYNLPDHVSAYTHRSGRTGRAGQTGTSIVIIQASERYRLRQIEKEINRRFVRCRIPTGRQICNSRILGRADEIANLPGDHQVVDEVLDQLLEKFQHMDRAELIRRFFAHDQNGLLSYYDKAPDLNPAAGHSRANTNRAAGNADRASMQHKGYHPKGKNKNRDRSAAGLTQFHLNVGRRQGVMAQSLIEIINQSAINEPVRIGKIDIMRNTAIIEAETRFSHEIMATFRHISINGKTVSIKVHRPHRQAFSARHRWTAKGRRRNAQNFHVTPTGQATPPEHEKLP